MELIFKNSYFVYYCLLLGFSSSLYAQEKPRGENDYTRIVKKMHHRSYVPTYDILNSNRPGFSVSPYNVGKGNFQVETGIIGYSELLGISGVNGSVKNLGFDFSLRYALNDEIEFYSDFNPKQNWYDIDSIERNKFSVSPISLGLAYRFNYGKGFIPTTSLRSAIVYYSEYNQPAQTDLTLTFATQNDLTSNWVVISNWTIDKVFTSTNLGFIVAITNNVTHEWSWFAEYNANYGNSTFDNFANAGIAYLLNSNTQIDLFGGTNLDINKSTYYISAGISWRLNKRRKRKSWNDPIDSGGYDHDKYRKLKNKGVN